MGQRRDAYAPSCRATPLLALARRKKGRARLSGAQPSPSSANALRYAGLCVLSHSFNAAFTRVCQPRPVALKASSTSSSSRIVVAVL